ncbi:MAG: Uma2 family endonuclease [Lachnospiraceae bacterium]|nr:Uma2 family endonuclease [Lachnospiraceae bacterium]
MDAAGQLEYYTIDDIYNLPGGQRAELIDGELYMMAAPDSFDRNKLTDEGCKGAPNWIIEIVSPSSRAMDYNKKLFKYRTAGVREYWIVDPMNRQIMVYHFEHDTFEQYSFSDKVKAGIYEDFEIDFSGIKTE